MRFRNGILYLFKNTFQRYYTVNGKSVRYKWMDDIRIIHRRIRIYIYIRTQAIIRVNTIFKLHRKRRILNNLSFKIKMNQLK